MKKTITINGNNFFSLNGFYTEIENALSKNSAWQNSRTLQALNDLLLGGLGIHDYQEPITLIWANSEKSKADFDYPVTISQPATLHVLEDLPPAIKPKDTLFNTLINLIQKHPHIELVLQ